MKIQFQNFISPINLKTPKITPAVSFGALECDKFEKSNSDKPSFEFCLNLFKRALLVTNSDISKDKLSEVYAPLSFNKKELKRFEAIITRPDYIEELNKISNKAYTPTMRQEKETMLLSTIYAAKADDKTYSKMEPFLNSSKLNLPKYLKTIYKMAAGDFHSGEFERFQELMEDENIISLVNGGYMDSNELYYMSAVIDNSHKTQKMLKSKAIRDIYKSGTHDILIQIPDNEIERLEALMENKNARELILNQNIGVEGITQYKGKVFEYLLKLLENNNYKNLLKKRTKEQNSAYHNSPARALGVILLGGQDLWMNVRDSKMPPDNICQTELDHALRFLENENTGYIISNFDVTFPEIFEMNNLNEDELDELGRFHKVIVDKRNHVLKHPELYVNGEGTQGENLESINLFFRGQRKNLAEFLKYSDNETLEALLRLRLDDAKEELEEFSEFSYQEKDLFKKMINCKSPNNKPFPPSIKLQFLGLIKAYKESGLSFNKINEMINNGTVNFYELNLNLFKHVIKNLGIDEEKLSSVPEDKITMWDMKYIHNLAEELNYETYDKLYFEDVIKASLFGDFREYINDDTNGIGAANEQTKAIFEQSNLNYENWVNPNPNLNVQFKSIDKNSDKLLQISKQIQEDIEALRKTPLKGIIDKRFKKEIVKGEFKIPDKCIKNKNEAEKFVKNIIEQLNDVWERAKENLNTPNKAQQAKNTLTILDHLNQRLKDIEGVNEEKVEKPVDLTIKMWDRNPPHDLFQGNYSTCCIGMGRGNGNAMPCYLLNASFNMIELVDNKTNKTIGNALCYFAKVNGETSFVIDNIEINNAKKPSDETGLKLRDTVKEYASKIAKSVTGKDDIPIYMGTSYNDVPTDDLKEEKEIFNFIGFIGGLIDLDESIYMDLYGGWVEASDIKEKIEAFRLK